LEKGKRWPSTELSVNSFENMVQFVEKRAHMILDAEVSKVVELKYKARRITDISQRLEVIDRGLEMIGTGEVKVGESSDSLTADLLVMRSKACLLVEPLEALKDARRAVELAPGRPQGLVAYALACEATDQPKLGMKLVEEALKSLQTETLKPMSEDPGVDATAARVLLSRLEKKAKAEDLSVDAKAKNDCGSSARSDEDVSDSETTCPSDSLPGSRRSSKDSAMSSRRKSKESVLSSRRTSKNSAMKVGMLLGSMASGVEVSVLNVDPTAFGKPPECFVVAI
jgi:hypothetical protein